MKNPGLLKKIRLSAGLAAIVINAVHDYIEMIRNVKVDLNRSKQNLGNTILCKFLDQKGLIQKNWLRSIRYQVSTIVYFGMVILKEAEK